MLRQRRPDKEGAEELEVFIGEILQEENETQPRRGVIICEIH